MKKKLIVGNWKMNPNTPEEAKKIFKYIKKVCQKLNSVSTVVCPPSIYIPLLAKLNASSNVSIGAQNVSTEEKGPYTGEISSSMLKSFDIKYSIVGHSERRSMGESDEIISKKVQTLFENGINPILCIGEKVREESMIHLDFLKNQIRESLNKVQKKYMPKLIIAYEPIWAIGAKEPMNATDIYEMTLFIRKTLADIYGHDEALNTPILYGGAVNFRNANEIMTVGKVDGLLVGRESVNAPSFKELLKSIDIINR